MLVLLTSFMLNTGKNETLNEDIYVQFVMGGVQW